MKLDILDRITLLLGTREQQELTKYLGLKSAAFSEWKSGKSKSYRKYLIEIADFFNVSLDYLVYGKEADSSFGSFDEEQHIKKYRILDEHGKDVVDTILDIEVKRCEAVQNRLSFTFRRLSENKVSAGEGFDLNDPDQWRSIEVVDTPEARQADFAVEVEGKSMEPDYHDGDIVYISLASEVPVGQVGLFVQNGKGYIKEAGDGCIISRNPEYDDIFPDDGNIECKGCVIGIADLI